MSLFALIGRFGPRGVELRKIHRPAHLKHLEQLSAEGRVAFAGPLMESGTPCGSLVVFEAPDLDAARAVATADPFVSEGVFDSFEVLETLRVLPQM